MTRPVTATRSPAIESVELGGEVVLYDERTGTVHHLNPSASAVWHLLDGRPIEEIARVLANATTTPLDRVRRDVERTVTIFRDAGLLADRSA